MVQDSDFDVTEQKPGTLVLAKFSNFPPWPAIVLSPSQVPLKLKKKTLSRQLKMKRGRLFKHVPVRFFGDNSFAGVAFQNVHRLTEEKLSERNPANPELIDALEEAAAYRYPEDFISILIDEGSISSPEEFIELPNILTLPEDLDQAVSKKRSAEGDDDDDNNDDTHITKTKKKKSAPVEDMSTDKLKHKVHDFRYRLQKGLIQRDDTPTDDELKACSDVLKELETFSPHITLELLKYSKLHKVLRAILKIPSLKESTYKFHERAENLLIEWENMILSIKNEKKDTPVTPNTSVLNSAGVKQEGEESSEARSQEPSEVKDERAPGNIIENGQS